MVFSFNVVPPSTKHWLSWDVQRSQQITVPIDLVYFLAMLDIVLRTVWMSIGCDFFSCFFHNRFDCTTVVRHQPSIRCWQCSNLIKFCATYIFNHRPPVGVCLHCSCPIFSFSPESISPLGLTVLFDYQRFRPLRSFKFFCPPPFFRQCPWSIHVGLVQYARWASLGSASFP